MELCRVLDGIMQARTAHFARPQTRPGRCSIIVNLYPRLNTPSVQRALRQGAGSWGVETMNMRFAALTLSTALLAACQSAPSQTSWLMQDGAPWVGPDGQCLQLRPLTAAEKQGFCYDVMTGAYQKKHHYEQLDPAEFAFLYPQAETTRAS